MASEISIKQGEVLRLGISITDDDGNPLDIARLSPVITSQLRDGSGDLVAALPLRLSTSVPGLLFCVVDDTGRWPAGRLLADFRIAVGGHSSISETFVVTVERTITQ